MVRKTEEKGNEMALTRDFEVTIAERVAREPEFAKALLDEAAALGGAQVTQQRLYRGVRLQRTTAKARFPLAELRRAVEAAIAKNADRLADCK